VLEIKTKQFGIVRCEEKKIISMPGGMPGFSGTRRFIVLTREESRPFFWYQSVDDPDLAFVIINPYLFKPDYSVDLQPCIREMLWENDKIEKLKVYVIVNAASDNPEEITANLMGPLVINMQKGEAVQMVVPNCSYSHKYPIFRRDHI